MNPHDDLVVRVDSEPAPGLMRPAIAAVLAGRVWPAGPEHDIAVAVTDAVTARVRTGWGPGSPAAGSEGH